MLQVSGQGALLFVARVGDAVGSGMDRLNTAPAHSGSGWLRCVAVEIS
jgi:hypothetical protein